MQQSTHEVPKSASQTVLSKVLITLHATRRTPHGDSRLLDATFAWSVKTRPAPSRIRRDASIYGHMTTGMHVNEYPTLQSCVNFTLMDKIQDLVQPAKAFHIRLDLVESSN